MGLDAVELVMEIEEAFAIKIPDDKASQMFTVGDVFEYVLANSPTRPGSPACLSAAAFYTIRQAANSLGNTKRFRPGDSTTSLLPDNRRAKFWSRLQKRTKLKLPRLARPESLVSYCAFVVVAVSLIAGAVAFQMTSSRLIAFGIAISSGFRLAFFAAFCTRPFAIHPPSDCKTLRQLAEKTLRMNLNAFASRFGGASENDFWVALRSLIVEQLGVSPDEVKPSAHFVNDLGCS